MNPILCMAVGFAAIVLYLATAPLAARAAYKYRWESNSAYQVFYKPCFLLYFNFGPYKTFTDGGYVWTKENLF